MGILPIPRSHETYKSKSVTTWQKPSGDAFTFIYNTLTLRFNALCICACSVCICPFQVSKSSHPKCYTCLRSLGPQQLRF